MRIHEVFGKDEQKAQKETEPWTPEEIEHARELYDRFQQYLFALGTETPLNPLPKREMDFLVNVIESMALRGKKFPLPKNSRKPD